MRLKILGSSSKGNCYILENETEALIIECGVPFKEIQKALDFNYSKVVGCLSSHIHLDHSKSIKEVLKAGIKVWASEYTHSFFDTATNAFSNVFMDSGTVYAYTRISSGFTVIPFSVEHDVPTLGFLINHPDCGTVLFATDTYFLKNTFKGLNNIIIEANYCEDILNEREAAGNGNTYVSDRVRRSHMSIQQCINTLQANDLSQVNNIVLIHLSDGNSHEIEFKQKVEKATGKTVHVASPGMNIDFGKTPF